MVDQNAKEKTVNNYKLIEYGFEMYPQQDSNLYLVFRKHLFYPLNYGGNERANLNLFYKGGYLYLHFSKNKYFLFFMKSEKK